MRPARGAVALKAAAFAHYCLFGHATRSVAGKVQAECMTGILPVQGARRDACYTMNLVLLYFSFCTFSATPQGGKLYELEKKHRTLDERCGVSVRIYVGCFNGPS